MVAGHAQGSASGPACRGRVRAGSVGPAAGIARLGAQRLSERSQR